MVKSGLPRLKMVVASGADNIDRSNKSIEAILNEDVARVRTMRAACRRDRIRQHRLRQDRQRQTSAAGDQGRPLHVFDAAKVRGNLTVRRARPGETLLALDGKTSTLDDSICVIADDDLT